MKKLFILSAIALFAIVSCTKNEYSECAKSADEISMSPVSSNGSTATRGYVETDVFEETYTVNLHSADRPAATPRTMQMSSYLYPQNGEEGNYFVNKTFAKDGEYWHATPAVYWPIGGTLDFLAYSLTTESQYNKGVTAEWDSKNAAQQVVLTVPAENRHNDILFASASNVKAQKTSEVLPMQFKHAQAWIEFQLTGSVDEGQPVVHFKSIEIENVYNAGTLTISNNGGQALAQWDFAGEKAQNVVVENLNGISDLDGNVQYMDMLIPQQAKTSFVLYYTLGKREQVLSYRFTTDKKTWLMGEKYIYKINLNANEITVDPSVVGWNSRATLLPENIEFPEGAIMSSFTVNDSGKKVAFSKGNLIATYHKATKSYTWGFDDNQLFRDPYYEGNCTIDDQYDGATVNLFGWSTANTNYGINTSEYTGSYYGDFIDWGTAIDDKGTWRTLSSEEWDYLLNKRPNASTLYSHVSYENYISYLVLAPDSFEGTIPSGDYSWENFSEALASAEAEGIVFLPATATRSGSEIYNYYFDCHLGYYWTSTVGYDDTNAKSLNFGWDYVNPRSNNTRYVGMAVRLVTDLK